MPQSKLLVHAASGPDGAGHRITPASAGWRYVGFETRRLKEGATSKLDTGGDEVCLVILSGKARVTAAGFDSGTIGERKSVFDMLRTIPVKRLDRTARSTGSNPSTQLSG